MGLGLTGAHFAAILSRLRTLLWSERVAAETVIVNATAALTVFGVSLLLARSLGPTGRGQAAAHLVAVTISFALGGLGLNYGAAFAGAQSGGNHHILKMVLQYGSAAVLITSILDLSIEKLLVRGHSGSETGWSVAAAAATQAASIILGWVQGSYPLRTWNALRLMQFGGYFIGVLALETLGKLCVTGVLAAYTISQVLSAFAAGSYASRHYLSHKVLRTHLTARDLWLYSGPVGVSSALYQTNQRWDQLLLSFGQRTADLGVYASAVTLAGLAFVFVSGIAQATYAEGLAATGIYRRTLLRRRLLVALAVSVPSATILTVFRRSVMLKVFGPAFERGAGALAILSWGTVFLAGNYVAAETLRSGGETRGPMFGDAVSALLTLSILPFAISWVGIIGAAAVSVFSYFVTFSWNLALALGYLGWVSQKSRETATDEEHKNE